MPQGEAIDVDLALAQILQALNVGALVAFCALLVTGQLIPRPVVKDLLKTRDDRIEALEGVSARKEEQALETQRMQAGAIKAQGEAMQLIVNILQGRGVGHA